MWDVFRKLKLCEDTALEQHPTLCEQELEQRTGAPTGTDQLSERVISSHALNCGGQKKQKKLKKD